MSSAVTYNKNIFACITPSQDKLYNILQIEKTQFAIYNDLTQEKIDIDLPDYNIVVLGSVTSSDSMKICGKSVILLDADLVSIKGRIEIKSEHRFISIASSIRSMKGNFLYSNQPVDINSWQHVEIARTRMPSITDFLSARSHSLHLREKFEKGIAAIDSQEKSIPIILNALTMTVHYALSVLKNRKQQGESKILSTPIEYSPEQLTDEEALTFFSKV